MNKLYLTLKLGLVFTSLLSQSFGESLLLESEHFGTQSNFEARLRSDSPLHCGVDFIDIGLIADDQSFIPQSLLAYDQYDETYLGATPKVRYLYSYNIPYKPHYKRKRNPVKRSVIKSIREEVPGPPPLIIGKSARKTEIINRILWKLGHFLGTTFPVTRAPTLITSAILNEVFKVLEYHRTRSLYQLGIMIDEKNQSLLNLVEQDHLKRVIGLGSTYSASGLLITERFYKVVADYQSLTNRMYRTSGFSKLISILNREGLIAHPINKDFIIVYYDKNKRYARDYEGLHTDLSKVPTKITSNGRTLVPLGIFSLTQIDKRLKVVDFQDKNGLKDRKTMRYLEKTARLTATAFIPFPFSLIIYKAHAASRIIVDKNGTHFYDSLVASEAELAALLDSGVAQLSPEMIEESRDALQYNRRVTSKAYNEYRFDEYREKNQQMTDLYLNQRQNDICKHFENLREKEFSKTYLEGPEKIARSFQKFISQFSKNGKERFGQNRKEIIQERQSLVDARFILKDFDESLQNYEHDLVINALKRIELEASNSDIAVVKRYITGAIDENIELAALDAAKAIASERFYKTLKNKINSFYLYEGLYKDSLVMQKAIQAFAALNISKESRYKARTKLIEKILNYKEEQL